MYQPESKLTVANPKSVYQALKSDNSSALELSLKDNNIKMDTPIAIYADTYEFVDSVEPVNQIGLFSKNRDIIKKTPAEIAAMMGHAKCLQWLLDNGADFKSVVIALKGMENESESEQNSLKRDEQANYWDIFSLITSYAAKFSPEQAKEISGLFTPDASDNESKQNNSFSLR